MTTVAELGEDAFVAAVVARLGAAGEGASVHGMSVLLGPGDDAAVVTVTGSSVLSTDTLVQGVDFRLDWSSGHDVGVKAAVQALADVEAMGALPAALLVALAVPGGASVDWCLDLADGLAVECGRAGAVVVGGDVAQAGQVVVTGTALGVLGAGSTAVTRAGACAGDVVAMSGATGASAAGLALLAAGRGKEHGAAAAHVLGVHRAPQVDHGAGRRALEAGARAMIDISDGLVRDARRVAVASGVRLDLDPGRLQPTPQVVEVAAALGADPQNWVMTSGEEHVLLACFDADTDLPVGFRVVGRVLVGPAAVTVAGREWQGAGGWTHYDRRP